MHLVHSNRVGIHVMINICTNGCNILYDLWKLLQTNKLYKNIYTILVSQIIIRIA